MSRANISPILTCNLFWGLNLSKRRKTSAKENMLCSTKVTGGKIISSTLLLLNPLTSYVLCIPFFALYCCQPPSLSNSPSARTTSHKWTLGFDGTTACLNLLFQRKSAPWLLQKLFQKTLGYLNVWLKMNLDLQHPVRTSLCPQVSTWVS